MRKPTEHERQYVERVLTLLREEFACWPTDPGQEWHLVDFAFYENEQSHPACSRLLALAAPLAVGQELVERYGCRWMMIESWDGPHFAVVHERFTEPVDLYGLDEEPLLDPDHHDDTLDPFDPGEGAHESLHALVRRLTQPDG